MALIKQDIIKRRQQSINSSAFQANAVVPKENFDAFVKRVSAAANDNFENVIGIEYPSEDVAVIVYK